MFQAWLFRRKANALLRSDFDYEIGNWQQQVLSDICTDTRTLGLSPGDAAAFFVEAACHSLWRPLTEKSVEFIERMSLKLLQAMNRGRISPSNFPRATRLYLLSKGAPFERLKEVDEMMGTFLEAMADGRRNGIVYDGATSMGLLFEVAVARGLVKREEIKDAQVG